MAFEIPNAADALNANQAEPDKVDLDILVEGMKGNGVVSGLAVTAQAIPDMTVAVAAGNIVRDAVTANITGANATIGAADATNPRFDVVVITSANAIAVRAGTAAAEPVFPALTAGDIALASVFVGAGDTAINSNEITDKRVFVPGVVKIRKTANEIVNNSTTLQDDDHLFFSVGANEVWMFLAHLGYNPSNTAVDLKYTFAGPAGATGFFSDYTLQGTSTDGAHARKALGAEKVINSLTTAADAFAVWGVIKNGATAGTLNLRWAQNGAGAVDTTLLADSWLLAQKVA